MERIIHRNAMRAGSRSARAAVALDKVRTVAVAIATVATTATIAITATVAMALAPAAASAQTQPGMTPSPLVPGNQADPHIAIFGERYYLYTTGFNCFSSPDLITWTKHQTPLDLKTLKWGDDKAWIESIKPRTWSQTAPWAPAAVARNGKYYFYFSADHYLGVAVADKPEGPYKDAIDKTLFDKWDGIDPMAFVDDDGEAYLFFGYAGTFGGVMAGVLNADMISWKVPPKLIANNTNGLKNYLEGPFMFKRNGIYYLTWSNADWQTPEYNVQYATAAHPLGPYTWKGRILEKDGNSVGPGHHSILRIPGRDQWYIVYHRYNHTQTTTNVPRTAHIDTLRFSDDGSIRKVIMTDTGVRGVNLADALKPTEALREPPGSQGAIPGLRLSCRNGEIELQSGSAQGRLELYDARGNAVASREFPAGAKTGVGLKAGGAYVAVIHSEGRTYRRALAAVGP